MDGRRTISNKPSWMTDAVYEATVSKLKRARPGSLPQPLEAAAVVKPVAAPEVRFASAPTTSRLFDPHRAGDVMRR